MWKATLYNKTVQSDSLAGLKQKMSKIANSFFSVIDEAIIQPPDWEEKCKAAGCEHWIDTVIKLTRINKKSPNNMIVRGTWR